MSTTTDNFLASQHPDFRLPRRGRPRVDHYSALILSLSRCAFRAAFSSASVRVMRVPRRMSHWVLLVSILLPYHGPYACSLGFLGQFRATTPRYFPASATRLDIVSNSQVRLRKVGLYPMTLMMDIVEIRIIAEKQLTRVPP